MKIQRIFISSDRDTCEKVGLDILESSRRVSNIKYQVSSHHPGVCTSGLPGGRRVSG